MTVSTVISPSCSNGVFLRFSQLWKAVPEFEHAYKDLHTDGMRQEPWEKGRLEIFVAQRFSAPAKIWKYRTWKSQDIGFADDMIFLLEMVIFREFHT